jgi:hypothetical protein
MYPLISIPSAGGVIPAAKSNNTEKEIEKTKKPYPDPQNHPYDFYITCPFCNKGVMEPPELVSFFGAFEDFPED